MFLVDEIYNYTFNYSLLGEVIRRLKIYYKSSTVDRRAYEKLKVQKRNLE